MLFCESRQEDGGQELLVRRLKLLVVSPKIDVLLDVVRWHKCMLRLCEGPFVLRKGLVHVCHGVFKGQEGQEAEH
eukprot:4842616-Amphidinium_carterae.1